MKIITLTLNPAFDIHCYIPNFAPYRENLARVTERCAGGKGVNISRALMSGGIESLALVVVGDENGDSFERQLAADKINYRSITVSGRIRENITVHTEGADETRISFEGFSADIALLENTLSILMSEKLDGATVTFTGRAPTGVDVTDIKAFLCELRSRGARLVIDSKSFSLEDITEIKPYLIKPNAEEISEYLGREIKSFEEVREAAEELCRKGIENVMISLGADGALLTNVNGVITALPPKIDAVSTIGAGDSSIAGFLAAETAGADSAEKLRMAVAYGTAACLTEGTRPPRAEDIRRILRSVAINKL